MVAVFASMSLATLLAWWGRDRAAFGVVLLCLGLAVWLFLFEIYSPDYGFGMPWLQSSRCGDALARG